MVSKTGAGFAAATAPVRVIVCEAMSGSVWRTEAVAINHQVDAWVDFGMERGTVT
jgi:heme O synthase-like polyprenyltransferase